MDNRPLAERIRPQSIEEFIGQTHLVGDGAIIRELITQGIPISLILWGPPGSGKTSIARIIAGHMKADFVELSAVTASKKDVVRVIVRAEANQRLGRQTILFIDEIHRFNKAQQDAFLPHVEAGTIYLIGATTENPSFEIINPLLSRSRVLVLHPLDKSDVVKILQRAANLEGIPRKQIPDSSIQTIADLSGGDARVALGILELALRLAGNRKLDPNIIANAAQQRVLSYDKSGDAHYNTVSAFIKSLRGSDATAALYYLARMLLSGEDPKFIARRMIVFASEDIGLAAPAALNLCVSTFLAVERIGLPECRYALFHCATVLAKAPKSRKIAEVMMRAEQVAKDYPDLSIPLHLRNAPTKLMKDLEYQKGYEWEADFKPEKGFLPDEISGINFFEDDKRL